MVPNAVSSWQGHFRDEPRPCPACTVRPLLNAIKGCIRKLLRKPFLKLILVAKFLYVYDILILSFENNQKNIFRKN